MELFVRIPFTESDAFELVRRVIRASFKATETNVFCLRVQSLSIYPYYSHSYSLCKFKTGKMSLSLVSSVYGTLKKMGSKLKMGW